MFKRAFWQVILLAAVLYILLMMILPLFRAIEKAQGKEAPKLSERQELLLKVPEKYERCGHARTEDNPEEVKILCWSVMHRGLYGPVEVIRLMSEHSGLGVVTEGTKLRAIFSVEIRDNKIKMKYEGVFDAKGHLLVKRSARKLSKSERETIAKNTAQSVEKTLSSLGVLSNEDLEHYIQKNILHNSET